MGKWDTADWVFGLVIIYIWHIRVIGNLDISYLLTLLMVAVAMAFFFVAGRALLFIFPVDDSLVHLLETHTLSVLRVTKKASPSHTSSCRRSSSAPRWKCQKPFDSGSLWTRCSASGIQCPGWWSNKCLLDFSVVAVILLLGGPEPFPKFVKHHLRYPLVCLSVVKGRKRLAMGVRCLCQGLLSSILVNS